MTYFVYWLYVWEDEDIYKSGYVGITNNISNRISKHRRKFKSFKFKIIFTGSLAQAHALEYHLRPDSDIGWNKAKGGLQFGTIGPMKGRNHSESTILKIKRSNTGLKRNDETKAKLREAKLNMSEETKDKIRKTLLGRKLSETSKAKVSEALRNRTITKEHRTKTSNSVAKLWETRRKALDDFIKVEIKLN